MNEIDFLKSYEESAFPSPLITVDTVLFTYLDGALKVLLVERSNHPEKGKWGLPGGFIDLDADKDLEASAYRKLRQKTGVTPPYLEQLQTLGNASRDKRGWSVTVCYTALIAHQACAPHVATVADVRWVDLKEAENMPLAFDHQELMALARERLKHKALYSIIPAYALPETFTLPELQRLHEALIGKSLQKKSFRRRIEQANLLIDTGEKRAEGGRPASLYRAGEHMKEYTFLRNLEA